MPGHRVNHGAALADVGVPRESGTAVRPWHPARVAVALVGQASGVRDKLRVGRYLAARAAPHGSTLRRLLAPAPRPIRLRGLHHPLLLDASTGGLSAWYEVALVR